MHSCPRGQAIDVGSKSFERPWIVPSRIAVLKRFLLANQVSGHLPWQYVSFCSEALSVENNASLAVLLAADSPHDAVRHHWPLVTHQRIWPSSAPARQSLTMIVLDFPLTSAALHPKHPRGRLWHVHHSWLVSAVAHPVCQGRRPTTRSRSTHPLVGQRLPPPRGCRGGMTSRGRGLGPLRSGSRLHQSPQGARPVGRGAPPLLPLEVLPCLIPIADFRRTLTKSDNPSSFRSSVSHHISGGGGWRL